METLPIIDLSERDLASNAKLLARTCETVGFFIISGHGIAPELQGRMRDVTNAFFDLSTAEKLKVSVVPGVGRGYRGLDTGSLSFSAGKAAPPDLRESFLTGPPTPPTGVKAEGSFATNIWPQALPEMQEIFTEYYRAMAALAARTLDLAAVALHLPENYFRSFIGRAASQLQVVNYPDQAEAPQENQLRASAHTDFGSLTFLLAENKPGGLQIKKPDGSWLDIVLPDPTNYIVNIGDLMARWTNDTWRSTLHRVVNPPRSLGMSSRRTSVVFFHHPNDDAIIECLPTCATPDRPPIYSATTAGDHMRAKIEAVYARKAIVQA